MRKLLFKWLGLNDLLAKHKELIRSNIELVETLARHQSAVPKEYAELKDRVKKLESKAQKETK